MRKRIWRLAEDQFDKEKQSLTCEPSEIIREVTQETEIRGNFTITGNSGEKIRGLVYSTNPYVVCENPKFDAVSHTLVYSAKLLGTKPGETLEGSFVVIAGGAQTSVPFLFEYKEKQIVSQSGIIRNLNDYTELARNHWKEAVGLFFSDGFEHILQKESDEIRLLYRGYRRGTASSRNLEEFLIAAGKKNRTRLFVSDHARQHEYVHDEIRGSIEIRKEGWGYFDLKAEAQGNFLTVESPLAGSESFLGDEFKISYYVDPRKLHAGKNVGKITVASMGQTWEIIVEASKDSLAAKGTDSEQYRKRLILKLYQDYTAYRLGRMDVQFWAQETNSALNELRTMDEEHALLYQLIRGYAYALNGNIKGAEEIISVLDDIIDDTSEERCFLKYIQYLLVADSETKRQIAAQIREISDPVREQYLCDWVLLQLQRDGNSERGYYYQAMYALQSTWNSPLFYIEMHEMLEKYPYLFTELNGLSLGYLSWMRKNRCFPKELVQQLARVTEAQKGYQPQLSRILFSCYEQYPQKELLTAIVRYLLSNQCTSEKFHHWFALAIEQEVNITGIYEAYLLSRPLGDTSPLPQLLTRFFVYTSHLSSGRRAYLYACVIRNKDNDPAMYVKYQPMIDTFAEDMILQGRIDENLAVVFTDYLERNTIQEETAAAMAHLLCVCKITCDHPMIARAYMHHRQLEEPVMATFQNGQAYLPVYTKEHLLLLETNDHCFVKDDSLAVITPLMDKDRWMFMLYAKAPEAVGYLISDLAGINPAEFVKETDTKQEIDRKTQQMKVLLASRHVNSAWKQEWLPTASKLLAREGENEVIDSFCDSETDLGRHSVYFRSYIIGNWIKRKQYHRAFMCLRGYNGLQTDPAALERLLVHLVTHNGLEWKDDFAVSLGAWLVMNSPKPLEEQLLTYLAVHYVGPTDIMMKIFTELSDIEAAVPGDIKEQIIVQELYSETFFRGSDRVFDSYRRTNENRRICAAYLNYWSNEAIHQNQEVPDHIYHYILEDMNRKTQGQLPAVSCQTALLIRLCNAGHLTQEETAVLERLLALAIDREAYFKAFEKIDQAVKEKYQLADRFFTEYRYTAEKNLYIYFEGDKKPSAMTESYPGIYAAYHVLFPGESVRYTIGTEDGTILTEGVLLYHKPAEVTGRGAYERLSDIAEEMLDGTFAAKEIADYLTESYVAGEMFPIL